MRLLKTFFLLLLTSTFLVACGDSADSSVGSSGGSTSCNFAALDTLKGGMSVQQVSAAFGCQPYASNTSSQVDSDSRYSWGNPITPMAGCAFFGQYAAGLGLKPGLYTCAYLTNGGLTSRTFTYQ